jgi:hypothetical protein
MRIAAPADGAVRDRQRRAGRAACDQVQQGEDAEAGRLRGAEECQCRDAVAGDDAGAARQAVEPGGGRRLATTAPARKAVTIMPACSISKP